MAVKNIVIFLGESTMDHRIIGTPRSPYNAVFNNCGYWDSATIKSSYTPNSDAFWGVTNGYTYDTYLMKKIADIVGSNVLFIKKAKGGATVSRTTSDGNGTFRVTVLNSHYSYLKNYIRNLKNIEERLGNTPVFKMVITDIKGNDAYYDFSSTYCNYTGGVLQGTFVDLANKLREITETPNLPIIHSQLLFKQTSLGTVQQRNDMLAAQEAFQTHYSGAYFLRMNEIDIAAGNNRYTMQPDQHLDDNGDWNKSEDMLNLLTINNLLTNWST